jgi:hypothetical protein
VRRGNRSHTLLLDTAISPEGMATNMVRLGVDVADIEAVVLSHATSTMPVALPACPARAAAPGCR